MRVLITRPAADATELSAALRTHGHEVGSAGSARPCAMTPAHRDTSRRSTAAAIA